MPTVRTLRSKGATIEVIASGEVLFLPGGKVHGWTRRFSNRVQHFTEAAAPVNKRPRWGHYGKPLKGTIVSKAPRFRRTRGGARLHAAVGSTSAYSYYVDQGTGIYNGKGPYQAKILPPWARQSPSLYEHTFKVPKPSYTNSHGERQQDWEEVGTVTVRGQKGQHYFDAGLSRAFQSMLRRSYQKPADPRVALANATWPHGLDDFKGNTQWSFAFDVQLREWRSWRQEAWQGGRILGAGYVRERYRRELKDVRRTNERALRAEQRLDERRRKNRERVAKWRAEQKAKGGDGKPKQRRLTKAETDYLQFQRDITYERQQITAALQQRYGAGLIGLQMARGQNNGQYVWSIRFTLRGVTKILSQVSGIQRSDPSMATRL